MYVCTYRLASLDILGDGRVSLEGGLTSWRLGAAENITLSQVDDDRAPNPQGLIDLDPPAGP